MDWLRSHPYFDSLVATSVVLVVGVLIVRAHSGVPPAETDTTLATWGSRGALIVGGVSSSQHTYVRSADTTSSDHPASYGYIPLNSGQESQEGAPSTSGDNGGFDFDALVAQLSKPMSGTHTTKSDDSPSSAYEFIPGGLIAVATPDKPRTPRQDALYSYGNEAGDAIQSFERNNPNQPSVLKNFMESRTDPDAIAAMKKLGAELTHVGTTLEAMDMETVPDSVQSAHTALAKSYKDIGAKLAAIPDARGDEALLKAIDTYDAAADLFVGKYVAVVLTFQSHGVVFSPDDSGSVFTFSNGSL